MSHPETRDVSPETGLPPETSPGSPGETVDEIPPARPAGGLIGGLIRTARPKQWVKNLLVFAAPGAAGVLDEARPLLLTILAFVCFCLAAAGTYLLNDAADVEADRRHPKKRFRPIAAGTVPVLTARLVGVGSLVVAVAAGFLTGDWHLPVAVATYVALTTTYTLVWKHIVVVDLVAVAAGFVVRAVAGAAATGVEVSEWFLIVASFGSIFMVAGKRYAELTLEDAAAHRATLGEYSASYLNYVRAVSSAVAITGYCLWAFERADLVDQAFWYQLSILPFVLAILRYSLLLDAGKGGAPEELLLGDRSLQVMGALWALVFAIGVYAS